MAAEEVARDQNPENQNDPSWGSSLAVQWSECRTSTAGRVGATPGPGTEVLQAACCGQKVGNKRNESR